jgi:hypothetical protein
MGKQGTFASMAWDAKGKVTRREQFLAEMDAVIPWSRLLALIEPYYPKAGQGRQPLGLEKMLRIYFLQQWFNLSDPQAEDAIYDSESMRRFARVELGDDVVPDESTMLRFRHLLEQHGLTQAIFDAVAGLLAERRLLLRAGTIVDATIIAAPSSTKTATDARVADITQLAELLHGQEREVFGDQAYWKEADRQAFGSRGALPDQSAPQSQAAELTLAHDQSGTLADPRLRRACVSGGQAAVGLHQSALPWLGQELGAGADHVRPGQSLPTPP